MPQQKIRLPQRYRDVPPVAPPIVEQPQSKHPRTPTPSGSLVLAIPTISTKQIQTDPNSFGVYRIYEDTLPTYDPAYNFSINQVADGPNFATTSQSKLETPSLPFLNAMVGIPQHPSNNRSVFDLMSWHYNSSNTKSLHDLDTLVNTVLLSDHFKTEELVGFDAAKEAKKIYDINQKAASDAPLNDGWFWGSVSIRLPCDKVEHCSEADAPLYTVNGLLY